MRTHIVAPNMKFFSITGMIVNGMQNTANNRSLIDKFNRNTLVTVRIRLFCINVIITSKLPATERINMRQYSGSVIISSMFRGGDSNTIGVWL